MCPTGANWFQSKTIQSMWKCRYRSGFFDLRKSSLSTNSCLNGEKKNQLYLKPSKNKASSNDWLQRQLSDPYVRWARVEQYRCRSAFKLLEINEKYKLLAPGMKIVDCGAAPGSWTQVLVKKINSNHEDPKGPKGKVISIDLQELEPIDGAHLLGKSDFTSAETQQKVLEFLDSDTGVDAVVSDMAPSPTGFKEMDHEMIVKLSYSALRFSLKVSKVGGFFITKIWDGGLKSKLESDLKMFYNKVQTVKPNASRSDSAEIFLLARDFKGLKSKTL